MQYLKRRFVVVGENSQQARDNYAAHYQEIFGTRKEPTSTPGAAVTPTRPSARS